MGQKKNFKYYLMIFGIAVLAILIYTVVIWLDSGQFNLTLLQMALIIPILFTLFLFIIDQVSSRIFPKRQKQIKEKEDFDSFVHKANQVLDSEGDFSIQDYRILQDSERFQKTLKQLYTIKNDGESEDLTIDYLSKKFKKTSIEYKAVQIIINEVKKID